MTTSFMAKELRDRGQYMVLLVKCSAPF